MGDQMDFLVGQDEHEKFLPANVRAVTMQPFPGGHIGSP
jgi:hypothetical protein